MENHPQTQPELLKVDVYEDPCQVAEIDIEPAGWVTILACLQIYGYCHFYVTRLELSNKMPLIKVRQRERSMQLRYLLQNLRSVLHKTSETAADPVWK